MARVKKSPLKLLVCYVDKTKKDLVLGILKNSHEKLGIQSLAEGTSKLGLFSNVLGIAKSERLLITTLVHSKNATRIVHALDLILCPDTKSDGIVFTIDINAIDRETLTYMIK